MSESNHLSDLDVKSKYCLKQLADALSIPVLNFFEPSLSGFDQTSTLLHMWFLIEDEHDRTKALEYVMSLATKPLSKKLTDD